MKAEKIYYGQGVGTGIQFGPAVFLSTIDPRDLGREWTADEGEANLRQAMLKAKQRLKLQMESAGESASAILEFQYEMLDDPALAADVWPAIHNGMTVALAWTQAIEALAAPFDEEDDGYFRARAADVREIGNSVLEQLGGGTQNISAQGAIVIANDLGPSRFLEFLDEGMKGLVLCHGGATSHAAILARSHGVPMVAGTGAIVQAEEAAIDAGNHIVITNPNKARLDQLARAQSEAAQRNELGLKRLQEQAAWRGDRVSLLLNIDDPDSVDPELARVSDGVGLWRTEFLFADRQELASEEEQYETMANVCRHFDGKPITIRTLDIGGDKPLPALDLPHESNPFLGLRGLRLCLARPEIWRGQLRAILRLAYDFPVKIMLPMVTVPRELADARTALLRASQGLGRWRMPEIGIMIETPASAIACDLFDADFFSIGSNDLTQYVMAVARDAKEPLAALANPLDPAVLRLITQVIAHGREAGKPVSVCGDMAADKTAIPALLDSGLRHFSVGQAALTGLRNTIAEHE